MDTFSLKPAFGCALRVDRGAVPLGAARELGAAAAVAGQAFTFARRAPLAQPALVNGAAGFVVGPERAASQRGRFDGHPRKIVKIELLAHSTRPRRLDLTGLDD